METITIRRSSQSFVSSTKKPVFEFKTITTGVRARFNPVSTSINRNVLGHTPKKNFRLFINPVDLRENDEVIRESDGEIFLVTEVKNLFGHHLEAALEEKK
ncbi:MAG: hypothetical protein HY401_04125 [Elusimicrobia bacterium]|nr:hypothetical protein [Elusimicrobiota bacterium]